MAKIHDYTEGSYSWAYSYDVSGKTPIDNRMTLEHKSDLVDPLTFVVKGKSGNGNTWYTGMQVTIQDTSELYVLKELCPYVYRTATSEDIVTPEEGSDGVKLYTITKAGGMDGTEVAKGPYTYNTSKGAYYDSDKKVNITAANVSSYRIIDTTNFSSWQTVTGMVEAMSNSEIDSCCTADWEDL